MNGLMRNKGFREFLRVLLALAIGLILGFIITVIVSDDPIQAYSQFLTGPLSRLNRIGDWIEDSLTLILLGLSLTIVFSAGQAYIGVEGQMIMGAVAAGVFVLNVPLPPFWRISFAFVVASLVGFLWALIPALLKSFLNASELVSSLMLNTIALRLFSYLLRYFIMPEGSRSLASEYIPENLRLPSFIPNFPFLENIRDAWVTNTSVSVIVYVIIAAVIAVYLLLYKTPLGYELRMVGSNPKFARYAGINIKRTIFLSMTLSGITAGLAGTHLVLAINNRLVDAMGLGIGFEGVNISTLARGNPLFVPLVSFLYGYMRAGAEIMERTSDVPRELVIVIQAVILLLVTAERLMPTIQQRINDRDENGNLNIDDEELEIIL